MNFLALLGWSPGDDRELFTRDELSQAFTLEGISGGNAVFNPEKLDWFNQQHIMRLPIDELASRIEPMLRDAGSVERRASGPPAGVAASRVLELFGRASSGCDSSSRNCALSCRRRSTTTRRRSRSICDEPEVRGALAALAGGARPRSSRSISAALETAAAQPRRSTRVQGGGADSRDARRRHRPRGEPRPVRGARTPGPRTGVRARCDSAMNFLPK